MNVFRHGSTAITSIILASTSCLANAQLSEEAGFSGEVSINAGYASQTSNFNTDDSSILTDENSKGKSDSSGLIAPLGKLEYTFGNALDKQVYLGTSRSDIAVGDFAFEIGYKQKLSSGTTIDASILPTIISNETWSDPYLTGQKRSTTDESGNAYRLKLSSIAGSPFTLDLAYADVNVDDENSGSQLQDPSESAKLSREGNIYLIKGEYRHFINRTTFLMPSIQYSLRDNDGSAMSYDSYKAALSLFKLLDKHQFVATVDFETRNYDAENPIYNKTRSDDEYSLFAAYEYVDFLGWDDVSFISFVSYGSSESNIDFYNGKQSFVSAGLNYKF